MTDPTLAGGALLDLTVYPLNFASMVLGNKIRRIVASMVPAATGVDGQDNVMIEYESGQMASLFSTMYAMTDREGQILGTKGFVTVENINNPQVIRVYASDGLTRELTREIAVPEQITGYEYELLSCKRAIEAGALECPEMPPRRDARAHAPDGRDPPPVWRRLPLRVGTRFSAPRFPEASSRFWGESLI